MRASSARAYLALTHRSHAAAELQGVCADASETLALLYSAVALGHAGAATRAWPACLQPTALARAGADAMVMAAEILIHGGTCDCSAQQPAQAAPDAIAKDDASEVPSGGAGDSDSSSGHGGGSNRAGEHAGDTPPHRPRHAPPVMRTVDHGYASRCGDVARVRDLARARSLLEAAVAAGHRYGTATAVHAASANVRDWQ